MVTQQAERHYRGAAGERYHGQKRALPPEAIPWVSRLRAEKFAPHLKATDTVFEYGAGFGWNLPDLICGRKLAFDLEDRIEPTIRAAGVEFVGDPKALASGSVDVAICHHTLEHVMQPTAVLEELGRLLRPAGKLLLYVPFEQERRYRRFDPGEPNHHLYSWNVQTLGNLVEECGFQVTMAATGPFGYDRFASVWARKAHLGETGFRALRRLLHLVKPAREVRIVAVRQ